MATRKLTRSTAPTPTRRYGWSPQLPDQRDVLFSAGAEHLAALPSKVDLRHSCPTICDQGALGSCTANAIAGAVQFDLMKQQLPVFTPSRLFIYFNERVMEHSVASDSGARIRDGIKAVSKQGVCSETVWPYDVARFAEKPPVAAYQEALGQRALQYQTVLRRITQMKGCLAAGFPFVFGFTVYTAFESKVVERTGVVDLPHGGEKLLGGHAVLAVGYDDATQRFIVRNSWGEKWGQAGYFTMPYAYLLSADLASDFWTIRMMQ